MSEYKALVFTILAIFVVTILGAFLSPSFSQQQSFMELFMLFGALLFIFSVLVIFATLGSKSFTLFLALFVGLVLFGFGVLAALFLMLSFYIIWGSIFALEVLLVDNGVEGAKTWFKERYTFKTFQTEFRAFYPLILLAYFMLEIVPSLFGRGTPAKFQPKRVKENMKALLD